MKKNVSKCSVQKLNPPTSSRQETFDTPESPTDLQALPSGCQTHAFNQSSFTTTICDDIVRRENETALIPIIASDEKFTV
jgi:hypothetical protein